MPDISIGEGLDIAVLIPCRNEASKIGAVVSRFRQALPGARIFVCDNGSTDDTALVALRAGARILREARPGKSHVVRRMFADIEADIYVLADGACDPADAPSLVNALITERVDMVVGTRRAPGASLRPIRGHAWGENVFDRLRRFLFGAGFTDISSGYRAFTRRFVKSYPSLPAGFGTETEISIHASQLMIPVAEIELNDDCRPAGSPRRLASGRDVVRTFLLMLMLMRELRPFAFCIVAALAFAVASLALGLPALADLAATGFGPLLTATWAVSLLLAALLMLACGLILESLRRARVEQKRILFLSVPALMLQ